MNSIGGERRTSASGAVFEVSAPSDKSRGGRATPRTIGTWPRSGAADVASALSAARAAAAAWTAAGAVRRREILAGAAHELVRDPDPSNLLAARVGADPDEIAPHWRVLPSRLERALAEPAAPFRNPRVSEGGLLLFAPAWSELFEEPAAALFGALLLGRTAVLVSDPHAPMLADALAAALGRGGLPRGVLSVVHDDGEDALRALFAAGAPTYVLGSGYPNRIRRLEKLASAGPGADFGAGVQGLPGPAVDLRILRSRALAVLAGDDLDARAEEVERRAFGRSAGFSGQLPGQIARVVCPERVFSRFSEALLKRLRASADVRRPIPIVERASAELLRRVRFLGLDENATLIFDGSDAAFGAVLGRAADGPDARSSALDEDAILAPTVFTNVEERMRIASFGRPIPVLCLLRAGRDEDALALAGRLDRDVPAEDLSLDPPE